MAGRKLSTVALAGSIAVVAIGGGCRDQALTAAGSVGDPAFAAHILLQGGDGQIGPASAALAESISVKVVDAGGTPVAGAQVNWTVRLGGGSVIPPTGLSDANGIVSGSWTLGSAVGANSVRAYLVNGYVVDSVNFSATAGAAAPAVITLDPISAPSATARVGLTLSPLEYTVVDQFGNPVGGTIVTFGTAFGSGTVTPTSAVTAADGHVSTVWTLATTVGTQTMSATLAGQLPLTTMLTATPDTSRQIAIVSGDNQTAAVNTLLPNSIRVQVTDRFSNVITGDVVVFSDSIGASGVVSPDSSLTDASGLAAASWQLGAIEGVQRIRVRTPGSGGQFARFTATATLVLSDVAVGNLFPAPAFGRSMAEVGRNKHESPPPYAR